MADLNELSAQEIGQRLRITRENADIRQDKAAQAIETSRPTLVAIEKGTRRVRIDEIQKLASLYGVSVNALLRRESVHASLVPRFRKLRGTKDEHTLEAVQLLNDLTKAEVELENVLGIEGRKNYPPERSITAGDVVGQAEKHAEELRDWLGMGCGPISDIFSLIEFDLGIRLYQRRLSPRIAGLFSYDPSIGACILLNANHPIEHRTQSAAHEIGHFVGTRQVPEVLELDERFKSRDEKYADAFGFAFLTPARSFKERFRQLTAGAERLTRRHIILLSHQFNISRQACGRRLEDLNLVKKGTWAWFEANGKITNAQTCEVLGADADRNDPAKDDANRNVSHRMSLMAHAAWQRGIMSEGQLAELLKIRRVELRELIDQIETEESVTDDFLRLPS